MAIILDYRGSLDLIWPHIDKALGEERTGETEPSTNIAFTHGENHCAFITPRNESGTFMRADKVLLAVTRLIEGYGYELVMLHGNQVRASFPTLAMSWTKWHRAGHTYCMVCVGPLGAASKEEVNSAIKCGWDVMMLDDAAL